MQSLSREADEHRGRVLAFACGDDRKALTDVVKHGVDERQQPEREEDQDRGCHAVSVSPEDDESQSLVVRSGRIHPVV